MSETKVVRNTSGKDIAVEYGGRDYRFDAGSETRCAADLADVAQYRHGHAGLNIVHAEHEAQEAATRAAAAAVETLPAEAAPAPAPDTFTCPHGDFSTNDKVEHLNHLASAHGLGDQPPAPESTAPPAGIDQAEPAPPTPPAKAPKPAAKKKEKK